MQIINKEKLILKKNLMFFRQSLMNLIFKLNLFVHSLNKILQQIIIEVNLNILIK
jgi:hypothetical protein